MARTLASGDMIRHVMQLLIWNSKAMGGHCAGCTAPTPVPLPAPGADGCNWTITVLPSLSPGCRDFVTFIVRHTMKEYNLK